MKSFSAAFTTAKNLKTGSAPVWIYKQRVGGIDYYLSDSVFDIAPWGVTTKAWVKTWGQITEGLSGLIDEFKISDVSITCIADPDCTPNIVDLVLNSVIEAEPASLYFWFYGCSDPPQEVFRGYVRDCPLTEGNTICTLSLQDETLKWQNTYVGKKVTVQDYPHADPDDIGKVMPVVYGAVSKLPTLAVDAGIQTALAASIDYADTSVPVSDSTGLSVGKVIQVDSEQMLITEVSGNALTVTRGYNGTLYTSHLIAAVVWEQKANFHYLAAGHPVKSMPKAFCKLGDVTMDISSLCTMWPNGDHPDFPGLAVLAVPGYVTVQQAVNLTIEDGIYVDNGTLGILPSGDITLSGVLNVMGSLTDPGHYHTNPLSGEDDTTAALPNSTINTYTYNWAGIPENGVHAIWMPFSALSTAFNGATSTTFSFSITWLSTYSAEFDVYAVVGETSDYPTYVKSWRAYGCTVGTTSNGFEVTFNLTNKVSNGLWICVGAGWSPNIQFRVSYCHRNYTGNSPAVQSGSTGVDASTLGVDHSGLKVLNQVVNEIKGLVAKKGTVTLRGNSVANTLVGDTILVDIEGNLSKPDEVVADLLSTWCGVSSFSVIGTLPDFYQFNGAITGSSKAIDLIHTLAWQCRCWFRQSVGVAQLVVRELNPIPAKTLPACQVSSGKAVHSQSKSQYTEIINTINLLYKRDWTQSSGDSAYQAVSAGTDQTSIDNFGIQERADLFKCDFITDQAHADDLRAFYLAYYAVRHWLHTHTTFYYDSELEFADAVILAFARNELAQIDQVAFNPGTDTIQINSIQ